MVTWAVSENREIPANVLNRIISEYNCDWIVELPSGVLLYLLYLLCITHQINVDLSGPDLCAYYTDEERLDAKFLKIVSNFKPEFDPE